MYMASYKNSDLPSSAHRPNSGAPIAILIGTCFIRFLLNWHPKSVREVDIGHVLSQHLSYTSVWGPNSIHRAPYYNMQYM